MNPGTVRTVPTVRTVRIIHYTVLAAVLAFSGYLLFKNLDDTPLWCDEAETALVARNFLKTGHCTAWDGRNLGTTRNGHLLDANLNFRNPPLSFYVTAASFRLFGESPFAARLPFAVIGLLTVLLLYGLIRLECPGSPAFALFSAAMLGSCAEYILYARNCRYYALAVFLALLVFFVWRRLLRRPGIGAATGLAAATALLYYTHFLICLAFCASLAVSWLLFERKSFPGRKTAGRYLLATAVAFVAATLPYTLLHHSWERPDMPQGVPLWHHCIVMLWYVRESVTTGFAPWLVLAGSVALLITRSLHGEVRSLVRASLTILAVNCLLIGLSSQQEMPKNPHLRSLADIRYLVACFPFAAILAGATLDWLYRKMKPLGLVVALVLATTNIASCIPWGNPRFDFSTPAVYSPLYRYWREIHRHFFTATEAVMFVLRKNAQQDETFYAFPENRNNALCFHLGSLLVNSCVLDTNSPLGAERIRRMSPFLLKSENFPDWVVFFGHYSYRETMRYFTRGVPQDDGTVAYHEYECFSDLPIFGSESNRPETFWHSYAPVRVAEPFNHVFIFRRVPATDTANWLRRLPAILLGARYSENRELLVREVTKYYAVFRKTRPW